MSRLSFQDFITQVGLQEAEKMNTCHDELGQFCSGTGGGGRTVTGPSNVIEKVSQANHPMNGLYNFSGEGLVNFETENQARLNLGKGRDSGQYLIRYSDGKFNVMGQPTGTKKKLLKDVNSVEQAIDMAQDHYQTRTGKPMMTPAQWYRKYPETRTINDPRIKPFKR